MQTRSKRVFTSKVPSTLDAMCELGWSNPDVLPNPKQLRAIRDRLEQSPTSDSELLTKLDELVNFFRVKV